ncbi:efflux RND transporter permease subunit [candidate division KSB1 bacterium]|nr:efflux RND transporter permease subunit [candidate division KSB1 bacterium]
MNLIEFVIRRKTLISMLFIGLCLLGVISYRQLPVELIPYAELPMLIVQVISTREVNPDYFERKAIIPLEGAIGTLENIDRIEANVNRRRGLILVYYNEQAHIKYAYLKLNERIHAMRQQLPEEFFVQVIKIDTEQLANMLMSVQVRGSGGINRVRQVVDAKIVRELENIDGIANVEVTGGRQKSVTITVNEDRVRAHGLTSAQIRSAIVQQHQPKVFLGYVHAQDRRDFVNLVAEYESVADLENIILKKAGPVRLKDVAQIFVGDKESASISRVNGKEAVTISLVRDAQVNMIQVARTTRQVISNLNRQLKTEDVEIVIQSDQAQVMEQNIDLIIELALIGGLLAVIVLWLFLQNIQLVLVVTLSIPISVLVAFNFLYAFNISLNSLTLVGMALAIGMLVDNSVVVLESIYQHLSRRQAPEIAISQGTGEVWRSILAATLTTMTVFLPFLFATNFLVRLLGKQIGISILATLFISLIVALLLIPMVIHKLFSRRHFYADQHFNVVSQNNRFIQIYTLLLKSAMRFPVRTVIGTVILFFLSIMLAIMVSLNTPAEIELNELNLYVSMPQGATLAQTDQVVSDLEAKLADIEEKEDLTAKIFEEEAILTLRLKADYQDIKHRTIDEIKGQIQQKIRRFAAADVGFDPPQSSSRFRQTSGDGRGMEGLQRLLGIGTQTEKILVKGHDFQLMRTLANDLLTLTEASQFVQNAQVNIPEDRPELHLLLDLQDLLRFNVTPAAIAAEFASFENEFAAGVQFKIDNEDYDILIRHENLKEKTLADLYEVAVPTGTGGALPITQLGQLLFTRGQSGINRVNQEREIEINYRFLNEVNAAKEVLETARAEIDQIAQSLEVPTGIAVEVIHDATDYTDFYFLIALAFVFIYMILASVFESFLTPLVIMFTIPLAGIGSFWLIIMTGSSLLNANTLIGFLILLGVVVNNGIILIDFTRILRQRNYSIQRALITAGQARLRPILITSITTIVALIPLAMGKAEYVAQVGAPFAITVIGGLTLSTLFTLIFIPTVYSGLEQAVKWWRQLKWYAKLWQLLGFLAGAVLIYFEISSLLWRLVNLTSLIILIPALTYFTQISLRRTQRRLIAADEPITIVLKHLVKIYDADARFVREWKQAERQKQSALQAGVSTTQTTNTAIYYKIPIWGFLIYFVYWYLTKSGWQLLGSLVVYVYTIWLVQGFGEYFQNRRPRPWQVRWMRFFELGLVWFVPLLNLAFFYWRWENTLAPILMGVFWYLALFIHATARRLTNAQINVDALRGRFAGIRRNFYLLVKWIPIIGHKKQSFMALRGISLTISNGMFGLLGPNGAGKTTLMRLICGILEPTRGTFTMNDLRFKDKREEFQSLIGYLPQEFGTYENMTAYDFLEYQAMLKGIWNAEKRAQVVVQVLASVHLEHRSRDLIGSFSGGMRQRIGIAQTLLHLPRILVVDEPTAGLDPRERIRFRNLLVELSRDRIVIFSTHIIEDISSSCNAVAVLDTGELKYFGTPEVMVQRAQGRVWQAILEPTEFEQWREQLWLVHHIQVADKIRVRFLATAPPILNAEPVLPTLEDAYLWLLGQNKQAV